MWTAWADTEILGCGALKQLDARAAEIKSMRTAEAHRGAGVGGQMLQHLIKMARQRDYQQLFLETGSAPAFEPAHALYQKSGFQYCGPFANYKEDVFSRFMVLVL